MTLIKRTAMAQGGARGTWTATSWHGLSAGKRRVAAAATITVAMFAVNTFSATVGPASGAAVRNAGAAPMVSVGTPVFAYYYMWMTNAYWHRNKLDHPVRPFPGDYNSANRAVMDWQIQRAKAAGITGFIVSWKDTATYRRILPALESAADHNDFKLAMDYEGLNAHRQPLPVARVAADFKYFAAAYARDPAWYRIGGKPLTIWNGTIDYSSSDVASVTAPLRSQLLVLNSANSIAEYQRLAAHTDGDAYYWSSDNPAANPGWAAKLRAMGAAVHRAHGIWIAPFAPGYNATMIGGHIIVPRNNGATLKTEYAGALSSSPDLLGLISWNEWTENTYVEPSMHFASTYEGVLKSLTYRAGRDPSGRAAPARPPG